MKTIKQQVKKILPAELLERITAVKQFFKLARVRQVIRAGCLADCRRFLCFAIGSKANRSQKNLQALILMYSHSLEKGMSLADPRPLFGEKAVQALRVSLDAYIRRYKPDWISCCGVAALRAYVAFNVTQQGLEKSQKSLGGLNRWLENQQKTDFESGVREITARELKEKGAIPVDFFYSRCSVRHFSPEPVAPELIHKAADIARKSPSVCNRQAWRVKYIKNPELIARIQAVAGGARGFGEDVSALLLVTCELSCFYGVEERNQCWVDGGIYTMALLYALHALGLGACCLNCCLPRNTESELRNILNLPESEVFIARIAVGNYPERLKVAISPRQSAQTILTEY